MAELSNGEQKKGKNEITSKTKGGGGYVSSAEGGVGDCTFARRLTCKEVERPTKDRKRGGEVTHSEVGGKTRAEGGQV